MYVKHVQVPRFINPAGQFGIITVKSVCADKVKINLPGLVFYDLPGQLGFGSENPFVLWDAGFITTVGVIAPILGKVQPGVDQGTVVAVTQRSKYGDLAIAHFSLVATILPAHSDALIPFLTPAAFIYDQGGELRFGEGIAYVTGNLVHQLAGAPVGFGDEMLHLVVIDVHCLADFFQVALLFKE